MSTAAESLRGTPETDAILCGHRPSTTATTKEQGSRAPSVAKKHSLSPKAISARTKRTGQGALGPPFWGSGDGSRREGLSRKGCGAHSPSGGRGTKQPATEPSLPCCRRPSLCGACPGSPADSPGTAEAPRAGSAWRRGPWSLESESELSQSAVLLHASIPHTLQGGNSQCPRRRADTIPAFLGKISNDASDKIPAGFLSKAV